MLLQLLAAVLVLSSPVWSGPTGDASSAQMQLDSEFETRIPEPGQELRDACDTQRSRQASRPLKVDLNHGTYDYIVEAGYPAERHSVHTDDGYILTGFRLPNPGKPAVYLQHGVLSSSADFVILGPGRALPYILFDAGYDVWLGNNRGTTESRKHERLNTDLMQYWDFSWHEIAIHDLPAEIDYVLAATNQTSLHYIGHSQGTTTFFVLGAERPEYMRKIKTFTALAPIAFLRDTNSLPLKLMAQFQRQLKGLLNLIGWDEFLPNHQLISTVGDLVCSDDSVIQDLCSNALFLTVGADSKQMNATIIPEILRNVPAGSSTKQLLHYGQLISSPDLIFRKYNHGLIKNWKRYGSSTPPEYNLSNVKAKTYLVYGENDLLSPPSNIERLSQMLPNIPADGVRKVPFEKFNHVDFLFASDAKELLYDDIVKILRANDN